MDFFSRPTAIKFMRQSSYTGLCSGLALLLSLISLWTYGLNFGLDFTGGIKLELNFAKAISTKEVENKFKSLGFIGLRVQQYGSSQQFQIRAASHPQSVNLKHDIEQYFNKNLEPKILNIEHLGAEVGEELAEKGSLAVLTAILAIMLYIAMRFEYRLAISAALSLCHDTLIVLGIFAYAKFEFDLSTLAALLAIIGYSLNDTIVVFDRVRENFKKLRGLTTAELIDLSINQTLSRTIMTSWMTLMVAMSLLFFGSSNLHSFAMALCLGIVIGTYSSIYIAGALALKLGLSKADLFKPSKQSKLKTS